LQRPSTSFAGTATLIKAVVAWDTFTDAGVAALYYEADDELFSDHTICAYIDANGEIDEPVLEG
jgi:hypothetical protein